MTPKRLSPPPVIGLVGGVASGKSSVAAQFASLGCEVIDADRLAHEALRRPEIEGAIRAAFGESVFDASGRIDRGRLGAATFRDRVRLARLESIVHPPVIAAIRQAVAEARAAGAARAVVLDAPLILEKKLDTLCDHVVYVETKGAVRQARAMKSRGWSPSELARRESMQLPLKIKRERADDVVDNSRTPEHALDQIRAILARIVSE